MVSFQIFLGDVSNIVSDSDTCSDNESLPFAVVCHFVLRQLSQRENPKADCRADVRGVLLCSLFLEQLLMELLLDHRRRSTPWRYSRGLSLS